MTEVSPMPEANSTSSPNNFGEFEAPANDITQSAGMSKLGTLKCHRIAFAIQGNSPAAVGQTRGPGREFTSNPADTSRPTSEGPKLSSDNLKPGNENPDAQRYMTDPKNLPPNGQRPPPSGSLNTQVRPPGVGAPGQPMRKPDGSGFQQPLANQTRPYQMPTSAAYSTSSNQPPPQTQTYSSAQMKGDLTRMPSVPHQMTTPATTGPGQPPRGYPTPQSYADQNRSMNPTGPRPQPPQGVMNRPPGYQQGATQRIPPENYQQQKLGGPQPMRPNLPTNPNMPPPTGTLPNHQSYNSVTSLRNAPSSTPSEITSESSLRTQKDGDASLKMQSSPLGNGPNHIPGSQVMDQSKTGRPIMDADGSHQKKPEGNNEKVSESVPVEQTSDAKVSSKTENKPSKAREGKPEEKEPGIVSSNVKFFEERDKAKVPLSPMLSSPTKSPDAHLRGKTSVPANVVKCESFRDDDDDDYESGVDETPMLHPNLRSIYIDQSLDAYETYLRRGRRKERSRRGMIRSSRSSDGFNFSCPVTPVRFAPQLTTDHSGWRKSRASSRSQRNIVEFSPEEELLYFFSLARAKTHGCLDRSHDLSKEDGPVRKGNMPTANGDVHTSKRTPARLPAPTKRSSSACSPTKTPVRSPSVPKSLPKTPDSPAPPEPLIKKVPMNKIQVGAAPSPNLKAARSKIGSLVNTTHKPGGGNIKIESHKIDFSKTQPRIAAKNDTYAPGGGDKKIQQVKLQWSAKPKVGSLENATHKPGGGDKKIESVKLDFKDKAKPKVGSKDNVKHVPGGGAVKIENQKLEFKAQSKIGSLDNVKHKPGGGDVKIFDDKTYLKQVSCGSSEGRASGTQSFCDLSIVSEVHSVSAPGTPHHGTDIRIRKSTTVGRTRPEVKKTTEVTVVSRSPSAERKGFVRSPSTHEVKLTYAKVASPKHRKVDDVGPVEVVRVPIGDNAAIFEAEGPDETPIEVKSIISNFEKQISSNKGPMFGVDCRGYPKTRTEPVQPTTKVSEELTQKFIPVKEELDRVTQNKLTESTANEVKEEEPMSKFLRNEIAAHEKVGEIWKEIHNIVPDKPDLQKTEEPVLSSHPPASSVALKPNLQQPQQMPAQPQQPSGPRFQSPQNPVPQQNFQKAPLPSHPLGTRSPQMQIIQRPQQIQNPQLRPLSIPGQRQSLQPEVTAGYSSGMVYETKPGTITQRSYQTIPVSSSDVNLLSHSALQSSITSSLPRGGENLPKLN